MSAIKDKEMEIAVDQIEAQGAPVEQPADGESISEQLVRLIMDVASSIFAPDMKTLENGAKVYVIGRDGNTYTVSYKNTVTKTRTVSTKSVSFRDGDAVSGIARILGVMYTMNPGLLESTLSNASERNLRILLACVCPSAVEKGVVPGVEAAALDDEDLVDGTYKVTHTLSMNKDKSGTATGSGGAFTVSGVCEELMEVFL